MVKIGSWWFMMLKKLGPSKKNIYEYSCFFPANHRGVPKLWPLCTVACRVFSWPALGLRIVSFLEYSEFLMVNQSEDHERKKTPTKIIWGPFGAAGGGPPKCFRILGDFFCDLIIIWHRDVTRAHGPGAQAVCLVQPPVFHEEFPKIFDRAWRAVSSNCLMKSFQHVFVLPQ